MCFALLTGVDAESAERTLHALTTAVLSVHVGPPSYRVLDQKKISKNI